MKFIRPAFSFTNPAFVRVSEVTIDEIQVFAAGRWTIKSIFEVPW